MSQVITRQWFKVKLWSPKPRKEVKFIHFILKSREIRESCHQLVHSPNAHCGWAWVSPQLGTRNSVLVSQVGGRRPVTCFSVASEVSIGREQDGTPALASSSSVLSSVLSARSSVCSRMSKTEQPVGTWSDRTALYKLV